MNIYKDITLILVTYRSENLVLKNLNILKKFPVIIFDNSNSDKLNSIIDEFDNIKLIRSDRNLGYGTGNNLAISHSTTQFILIVNPDIILNENSIKTLLDSFLHDPENIGILGPSLYDHNMNRRTNGSISYIDHLKGIKISNAHNNIPFDNTCCKFLMGCCYFMRRDFFNTLGGFDENFFMYFEDNDLCDRSIKNGKYIMEVPLSKFIHLENSSYEKKFLTNTKLSIIHKISSYVYLKKNVKFTVLLFQIMNNFIDYFLRFFVNFFLLRFKKSYKNFLRIISLILFVSFLYKLLYKFMKI